MHLECQKYGILLFRPPNSSCFSGLAKKPATATQELKVTKCNATFDVGLTHAAVVYDGLDSVYVLGA